jgi:hypothetical protein
MLLPKHIAATLPPIGGAEAEGLDALARARFFTPDAEWTWYASEYDGADLFFGFVVGIEPELGCFSLADLAAARGGLGLPVEWDAFFEPAPLRNIMRAYGIEWAAKT